MQLNSELQNSNITDNSNHPQALVCILRSFEGFLRGQEEKAEGYMVLVESPFLVTWTKKIRGVGGQNWSKFGPRS